MCIRDRVNAAITTQMMIDRFEVERIINTGIAGAVHHDLKGEAMENLKGIGKIVYLRLSYEALKQRLGNLHGRGVIVRKGQTLLDIYQERIPLYEQYADLVIDEEDKNIEETLQTILDSLGR